MTVTITEMMELNKLLKITSERLEEMVNCFEKYPDEIKDIMVVIEERNFLEEFIMKLV